jgi:hypothetical protein
MALTLEINWKSLLGIVHCADAAPQGQNTGPVIDVSVNADHNAIRPHHRHKRVSQSYHTGDIRTLKHAGIRQHSLAA